MKYHDIMTETNNSENTQSTIAERLRLLIVTMRKSQAEFAKLISVDPGNLSKMLTGRTRLSSKMLSSPFHALPHENFWVLQAVS